MGGVNDIAASGFTRGADAYAKARPDYPADAIAHIIAELQIDSASVIADIGAGTGKLTQALVPTGAKIYAVEPLEAMRAKIVLPGVSVIASGAEEVPLPSHILDGITVAQAFHWFDGPLALSEFHRLLKPGKKVALIWNQRDLRVPWIAAIEAVVKPYENIQPHDKLHATTGVFASDVRFSKLTEREFSHTHVLDHEDVVTRVASISYIANLDDTKQRTVFDSVRKILRDVPEPAEFAYRTRVYIATAL